MITTLLCAGPADKWPATLDRYCTDAVPLLSYRSNVGPYFSYSDRKSTHGPSFATEFRRGNIVSSVSLHRPLTISVRCYVARSPCPGTDGPSVDR